METLTGSEAIYGFCAWLTGRTEQTKMSSADECGKIPGLIETFCDVNKLKEPRSNYVDYLTHPKG